MLERWILIGLLRAWLEPSVGDALERAAVQVMELVAALALGLDQVGGLEHVQEL
jgi:hypothetical protein